MRILCVLTPSTVPAPGGAPTGLDVRSAVGTVAHMGSASVDLPGVTPPRPWRLATRVRLALDAGGSGWEELDQAAAAAAFSGEVWQVVSGGPVLRRWEYHLNPRERFSGALFCEARRASGQPATRLEVEVRCDEVVVLGGSFDAGCGLRARRASRAWPVLRVRRRAVGVPVPRAGEPVCASPLWAAQVAHRYPGDFDGRYCCVSYSRSVEAVAVHLHRLGWAGAAGRWVGRLGSVERVCATVVAAAPRVRRVTSPRALLAPGDGAAAAVARGLLESVDRGVAISGVADRLGVAAADVEALVGPAVPTDAIEAYVTAAYGCR